MTPRYATHDAAIKAMAVAKWPGECCGVVTPGGLVWVQNDHEDVRNHFHMPASTWQDYTVQAVVHSHTVESVSGVVRGGFPDCPSRDDMVAYLDSGVPWGIVCCDNAVALDVLWLDDAVNLGVPLVGRKYVSGVFDCGSLVRSYYWQTRHELLTDYPRGPDWYKSENIYMERYQEEGFEIISHADARDGDMLYFCVGDTRWPNHSGIYTAGGLLLHHPAPYPVFGRAPSSVSRVEPLGRWAPYLTHVLRMVR